MIALVLALTLAADDGSGSDAGHAASRVTAVALLGAGAFGGPLLAHAEGAPWSRALAGQLGGALGFGAGALAGGLLAGPFDGAHTNRTWILPLATLPPLLAEAGFLAGDTLVARELQPRGIIGSFGGLLVGSLLVAVAGYLAEALPAPTHTMLAFFGLGAPLAVGGCMAAGAAIAR